MTDVKLVKDCGLYPSYKKIIDFTGTKSEIIQKQLTWIDAFENDVFLDVNYNKFQNRLTLPIDYTEALSYTYCVLTNITGTDNKPQFFFINDVVNLTNGIEDADPNVSFDLSLDPIMTFMGEWNFSECLIDVEHVDRWSPTSALPIRITPNIEGAEGFVTFKDSYYLTEVDPIKGYSIMLCVLGCVEPNGYISMYAFPINPYRSEIVQTTSRPLFAKIAGESSILWPTLDDIRSGRILDNFSIQPDSVVSCCVYPLFSFPISYADDGVSTLYAAIGPSSVQTNGEYSVTNFLKFSTDGTRKAMFMAQSFLSQPYTKSIDINIGNNYPIKPNANYESSERYEPALFANPHISYTLNDGINDLFELPNNVTLSAGSVIHFKVETQLALTNAGTLLYVGDDLNEAIGNNAVTFIPVIQLEIGNDLWLQYSITSKDADRQIVVNNAIKMAIDNLVYMSYGGALVGSRSATAQPLYNKGRAPYSVTREIPGLIPYGSGQSLGTITDYYPGSRGGLTGASKRMLGATGLAAGASVITSLVDAHFMWQNQMLEEKKIKNQASGLLQGGASLTRLSAGYAEIKLIIRRFDNINYEKAYRRYKRYGYVLNKFDKPNISSRLYYNYLLTNGCIIEGAINQSIRDIIASIFDAGVTIFHYDSGDTTTRRLEYTDKENIEVSLL